MLTSQQIEELASGKTEAELWEEDRLAHWKLMREAWERYNQLVAAHEAQGFNGPNPFEPDPRDFYGL